MSKPSDNFLPFAQDADGYLPNLSNFTGPHNESNVNGEERNLNLCISKEKSRKRCCLKKDGTTSQNLLTSNLLLHKVSHNNGSLNCPFNGCLKSFTRLSTLKGHLKDCTLKKSRQCLKRKWPCSVCCKTFKDAFLLNRHFVIHTGEKLYNCDHCGASFNQKWPLITHINAKHIVRIRFSCSDCPATFATKGNLKVHLQQVHPDNEQERVKLLQCPLCNSFFKSSSKLSTHHAKYHQNLTEDQQIQITIKDVLKGLHSLNNDFEDQREESSLMSYYNVAAYTQQYFDGVRWYKCRKCDCIFKKIYSINRHMKIHENGVSFECAVCNEKFRLKSYLTMHLKTHNSVLKEKITLENQEFTNETTGPNLSNYPIINIDLSSYINPKYFLSDSSDITRNKSMASELISPTQPPPHKPSSTIHHEPMQTNYILPDDFPQCDIQFIIQDNLGTKNVDDIPNSSLDLGSVQSYDVPAISVNLKQKNMEQNLYENVTPHNGNGNLGSLSEFKIDCPIDGYANVIENVFIQGAKYGIISADLGVIESTTVKDNQFNDLNQLGIDKNYGNLLQNTFKKDEKINVVNYLTVNRDEVNLLHNTKLEINAMGVMGDKQLKCHPPLDLDVGNFQQNTVFENSLMVETQSMKNYDNSAVCKGNGNLLENAEFESTVIEGQQCDYPNNTVVNDDGNILQNSIAMEDDNFKHHQTTLDVRNFLQNTSQNIPVQDIFETLQDSNGSQILLDDISTLGNSQIINFHENARLVINTLEINNQCENQVYSPPLKNTTFSSEFSESLPRGTKIFLFLPKNSSISLASQTDVTNTAADTNMNNILTSAEAGILAIGEEERCRPQNVPYKIVKRKKSVKTPRSNINNRSLIKSSPGMAKKTYDCKICNIAFKTDKMLGKHLHSHIRKEMKTCLICKAIFKKKCDFDRHQAVHSKEKLFECKTCQRKFSFKASLRSHQLTHMDKKKRPKYKCKVCDQTFTSKASVRMHVTIHNQVLKYQCAMCEMKFRTPSIRKSHVEIIHKTRSVGKRKYNKNKYNKELLASLVVNPSFDST